MKLLFFTAKPFYPESSGGAQQSALLMFEQLQRRGWEIEVLSGTAINARPFWRHAWQRVSRGRLPSRTHVCHDLGYPCWRRLLAPDVSTLQRVDLRFRRSWVEERLRAFEPDVVVSDTLATDSFFRQAAASGYPCVKIVRSLPVVGTPSILPPDLHLLGNSPYTARIASGITGRETKYVLPPVEPRRYRAEDPAPRTVTFINPTEQKGVGIATEVARRLPEQPFLFVKGRWSHFGPRRLEAMVREARRLPNVTVWENQTDMRKVYAVTKVLLVPSQFIETFGRVIVEAHVNGIPVVAANVGGIPYTLGGAGTLVEPRDDAGAYVEALQTLLRDETAYRESAALARRNADRPEFDVDVQLDAFVSFLEREVLARGAEAPGTRRSAEGDVHRSRRRCADSLWQT